MVTNSKYTKACKTLRNVILMFISCNLAIIAMWTVYIVIYLERYISQAKFISQFEVAMLSVCVLYLVYLYIKYIKTEHVLFKKLIAESLEVGIFSLAILVVFSALKIGVASSMNYITYYLDYYPQLKLKETKLMEMVLVYPGFVCFFVTSILHMGIKVLRKIATTYKHLKSGATLDTVYFEENEAEEADDY